VRECHYVVNTGLGALPYHRVRLAYGLRDELALDALAFVVLVEIPAAALPASASACVSPARAEN